MKFGKYQDLAIVEIFIEKFFLYKPLGKFLEIK